MIAALIKGPIEHGDTQAWPGGVVGFLVLAVVTQFCLHFRQRLALELGEAVVHDLRRDLFAHLQRMPMSFFHRTKLGRIISRMTTDVEYVRMGVQEVLFVSLVQVGQMTVAAAFMLWYDPLLFLLVLALVPVLWLLNRHFNRQLSKAASRRAGVVQPRDGHVGRKRQRNPRHAGFRAARCERKDVSANWSRIIHNSISALPRCRVGSRACWI